MVPASTPYKEKKYPLSGPDRSSNVTTQPSKSEVLSLKA